MNVVSIINMGRTKFIVNNRNQALMGARLLQK